MSNFPLRQETLVKATKPDSNIENVRNSVINVPEKPENNPDEKASQVGTDIAIKYIRNNKIMESNILSTSTKLQIKKIYMFWKRLIRGGMGERRRRNDLVLILKKKITQTNKKLKPPS